MHLDARRSPGPVRPDLSFPALAQVLGPVGSAERPLKVCIVTREFFGPFKNGGIGTAYTHLAHFLTALGHEVTVYFSTPSGATDDVDDWVAFYARYGIHFVVGQPAEPPSTGGPNSQAVKVTRQVYEWLKTRDFDVVHVSEYLGDGYFSLVAKRMGLAFDGTTFVVKTSSPTLWCNMGNDVPVTNVRTTLTMYIERMSVELADWVISPSQHMLRWMTEFGYALPDRSYVQPNLIIPNKEEPLGRFPGDFGLSAPREVGELVFFGRLEWRKGLVLFCRALRALAREGVLDDVKITLLGKSTPTTRAYVESESRHWSFEWQILDDRDSEQAIAYLLGENRVACIPSLVENSAFTIYESLLHRIPFIASDTGGNAELVAPDDRSAVIFPAGDPSALAQRLRDVLTHGIVVARPSFDFADSRTLWESFHAHLATAPEQPPRQESSRPKPKPKVSICMAHFNRPAELRQALESVRALSYPNFEVILTDDGSDDEAALCYLEELAPEFESRGWQIVHQENRYLGAARNTSARRASGEYLLFMDDDNLAKPHELDVFVDVALRTDADILTCFADVFTSGDPRLGEARILRETPIGDDLASGIVKNIFGDANALIRRESFEQLGGFTEDYGTGTQDYELFLSAVVQGYRLMVIPEALFWYRQGHRRMNSEFDTMERGRLRAIRAVQHQVPWPMHIALRLAQGSTMELSRIRGKYDNLRQQIRRLEGDFELLSRTLGLDQPASPVGEGDSGGARPRRLSRLRRRIALMRGKLP